MVKGFSVFVFASCFFPMCSSLAGQVNSLSSFPVVHMNPSGISIAAGDQKLLLIGGPWQKGLWIQPKNLQTQRFFAGISNQSHPSALVCAGPFLWGIDTQIPPVRWEEIKTPWGESGQLICSVSPKGEWIAFNKKTSELWLPKSQTKISLPTKKSFQMAWLLPAPSEEFTLILDNKTSYQISTNPLEFKPFANSFPETFSPFSTFAGGGDQILMADDGGLKQISVVYDNEIQFAKPQRLPVNPCHEDQVCGLNVDNSGRILVSGYFGTFYGKNTQFQRINHPNFSESYGGVAIAHNGSSVYYIGNTDADQFTLPALSALQLPAETIDLLDYAIWTRKSQTPPESTPSHPSHVILDLNQFPREGATSRLDKIIRWKTALPKIWPRHWVQVEQNQVFQALDDTPKKVASTRDWASDFWEFTKIEAWLNAHLPSRVFAPITVGIVDSGIDLNHPALKSHLHSIPSEIPNNGLDDDQNGFVDDVHGYDFLEEDNTPQDDFGHGTHVAGLINHTLPSGENATLAPHAQLLIGRAIDSQGKSNNIDLARAVVYLANADSRYINCSWGGGASTQVLRDAFLYAQKKGSLMISSAGNSNLNLDTFPEPPKSFPNVINIGSVQANGSKSRSSNFGSNLVFAFAPGDERMSTLPGGLWGKLSGTSMASPTAISAMVFVESILNELGYKNPRSDALNLLCSQSIPNTQLSKCGFLNPFRVLSALSP